MFDPEQAVNETIDPTLVPYALNKVGNLKYIELDYFMTKGCREAQMDNYNIRKCARYLILLNFTGFPIQ